MVTGDPALAERLRLLRQYGQADRYNHVAHGVNSRLDELQAAVVRASFRTSPAGNARRNAIAARMTRALGDVPVQPLRRLAGRDHAFHLSTSSWRPTGRPSGPRSRPGRRDARALPPRDPRPPALRWARPWTLSSLAVSEDLAERVVSLPLYPELTDAEVEHVADVLSEVALAVA